MYPVSVYNKDGKLKKSISTKTLHKRHWEEFDKRERSPKKFVLERIKADQQELLRKYQRINNISDELHEDSDG